MKLIIREEKPHAPVLTADKSPRELTRMLPPQVSFCLDFTHPDGPFNTERSIDSYIALLLSFREAYRRTKEPVTPQIVLSGPMGAKDEPNVIVYTL